MPTEPLAALVYVFLLVPGIAYTFESSKHRPAGKRSVFAETSTVVVASSVFFMALLTATLVASLASRTVRSWIDAFFGSPTELFTENPRGALGVVILFLLLATMLGFIFGRKAPQDFLRGLLHKNDHIEPTVSSWWKSFELVPGSVRVVSVQLKSGRWISGQLVSFSPSPEDTLDRAFVLSGKIKFRAPGSKEVQVLAGVQSVVVHASEIDYFGVDYVTEDAARKMNE